MALDAGFEDNQISVQPWLCCNPRQMEQIQIPRWRLWGAENRWWTGHQNSSVLLALVSSSVQTQLVRSRFPLPNVLKTQCMCSSGHVRAGQTKSSRGHSLPASRWPILAQRPSTKSSQHNGGGSHETSKVISFVRDGSPGSSLNPQWGSLQRPQKLQANPRNTPSRAVSDSCSANPWM